MTEQTITRSPGLPITVNGRPTPWIAGGGFRGTCSVLDETVQQAAERLAEAYQLPVVIRFNSDRRSGGAWLRTHKVDGFGANAEIGICARLWSPEMQDRAVTRHEREIATLTQEIDELDQTDTGDHGRIELLGRCLDMEHELLEQARTSEPGVYVQAHIGANALADKTLATSYLDAPVRAYYHADQETIAAALAFVRDHGTLEHLDLDWIAAESAG